MHSLCFDVEDASNTSAIAQVTSAAGQTGTIEGTFGKSGKFKVHFPEGIADPASSGEGNGITLAFKKFIFGQDKRHMVQ